MEYVNHRKHSAGARNVKARAKRALLLPSSLRKFYTTDGLVNTQDISTCQSFLGHVGFCVFIMS